MKIKELATLIIIVPFILPMLLVDVAEPQVPFSRVFIKPNGNIEPTSAPIQQNGNTYMLTADIYAGLVVQKAGIIIDGAGFTLQGPYNGTDDSAFMVGGGSDQVSPGTSIQYPIGIDYSGDSSGLTIINLNIKNFSIGTYIWTQNNLFTGNNVSDCIVGVLLSGSDNKIMSNYIANNKVGLFFGSNDPSSVPLNLTVSHNIFQTNIRQLGGCLCQNEYNESEPIHTWDDGKEGNYWSDYNGADTNGDGIGDTPYVFDPQNQDRYPLMVPPTSVPEFPILNVAIIVVAVVIGIAVLVTVWSFRRKRNKE